MTQIDQIIGHFFNKNPDIKGARNKGLINRRALARYIIKTEDLNINKTEAIVSTLRRFEKEKDDSKELLNLFKQVKISTKDKISILSLEKSIQSIQKLKNILSNINYTKNESLKIIDGSSTIKLFVDESNLKGIKEMFTQKEIQKIYSKIAEITMTFPDTSIKTKGIVSYITTELNLNNINLIEILTATPELILYLDDKDLLKAYDTINNLR
tara:strand:+ start:3924 stop:4559 length:636 start_codon:yes stop_codon:yes gene_type:complete